MDRAEHLQWSKDRAQQILDSGDVEGAYTSFLSDMNNHPDTAGHPFLMIGFQMQLSGQLATPADMKKFINDFN